jgi:hypothetical protein
MVYYQSIIIMPITLQEIKNNALAFVQKWQNETSEEAEAKSFWDDFFEIFGIQRYKLASFEKPVKKTDGKQGYIDLLWKGELLVEHKSRGKDLDRAYKQATDYFEGLKDYELPKYVLVTDFEKFRLYDLINDIQHDFLLKDLLKNLHLFMFMVGYQPRIYKDTDEVNVKTAEFLGKLHEQMQDTKMDAQELDLLLVRLVFCMFADDTGIFEKNIFWEYIDKFTEQHSEQILMHILAIFDTLDMPEQKRNPKLEKSLAQFPYINGTLFKERLRYTTLTKEMREMILKACSLDWGTISPAIFGSMFQAAMNSTERRNLGAHYTSEGNIKKVIRPLFLDELYEEFEQIKHQRGLLEEFHDKIASLLFLDPACGCGNFLIITYRELRELELLVLKELYKHTEAIENIDSILKVSLSQFYGIEIDDFAAQIATLAMWLTEHQMNIKFSQTFGKYYARIPLKESAKIVCANSLQMDWAELLVESKPMIEEKPAFTSKKHKDKPSKITKKELFDTNNDTQTTLPEKPKQYNYILGNPPFIGKQEQNVTQKIDVERTFAGYNGIGVLDYVACWYLKAAQYIKGTKIKCAFVSTNSITQGEQAGILWNILFKKYRVKIHFAHRTFAWKNEAKDNAAVHCVIVGLANFDTPKKKLFDYLDIKGEPTEKEVSNINPYLSEGNDLIVLKQKKPLVNVPEISFGSMPNDGGHLLLTNEEKNELLAKEPQAKDFIRPLISAKEFLNGETRWCLWLTDIEPQQLKKMPLVHARVKAVEKYRQASERESTQKLAEKPMLFAEIRKQEGEFIVIPRVSSEHRRYIPMLYLTNGYIVSDSCLFINNANKYIFGILNSSMHMTWVKYIAGRLESRFRYSNEIVYNNFPFPSPTEKERAKIEACANKILEVRALYPNTSLADLYNKTLMPSALTDAHNALDKAVDVCYSKVNFVTELERVTFLFEQYDKLSAPLYVASGNTVEQHIKQKIKQDILNNGIGKAQDYLISKPEILWHKAKVENNILSIPIVDKSDILKACPNPSKEEAEEIIPISWKSFKINEEKSVLEYHELESLNDIGQVKERTKEWYVWLTKEIEYRNEELLKNFDRQVEAIQKAIALGLY